MSLKTAWLNLQDNLGNRFAWSHVNAVYYNWAQKKLLKEKLDDIDTAINAKVAKTDIVQVESTSQSTVPSSAYLKSVKDALDSDISELNSGIQMGDALLHRVAEETSYTDVIFPRPFANAPKVFVTGATSDPLTSQLSVQNVNESGFRIYGYSKTSQGDLAVMWAAICK